MVVISVYFLLFVSSVYPRHVPRFADLDEEDQHLFRAAYETPAYDHDEYQENDDLPMGKLDLLNDGLWAVKAKIKELKAFNKALVANLLSTKIKVKELLANSAVIKKHQHGDKKPSYNYQASSSQQEYAPQYGQSQYTQAQYTQPQYGPAQHAHDPYYGQ